MNPLDDLIDRVNKARAEEQIHKHYILAGTVFAAFFLYSMFSSAFVTVKLWKWFMVPLKLPPINMAQGLGIGLCVVFMTGIDRLLENPKGDQPIGKTIFLLVRPWITLGIGWVFYWFSQVM